MTLCSPPQPDLAPNRGAQEPEDHHRIRTVSSAPPPPQVLTAGAAASHLRLVLVLGEHHDTFFSFALEI